MSTQASKSTAVSYYEVHRRDLPVHCPMDSEGLWSAHPRVYLPLEQNGRATCPYCGAEYILVEDH